MSKFKYKYDDLFNPSLEALHALGGSGTISEIEEEVANILHLTEEEINEIHRGNRTKFSYLLAWARNYLKNYGLLENSSRGVWALTGEGSEVGGVDKNKVKKEVQKIHKKRREDLEEGADTDTVDEIGELDWQEELLEILQDIPPNKFERLCQRMLRESGFINVEVTGRTGDGGIDGNGVIRIGGVVSFTVVFQCKRYKGSVSPSQVRDFRGAMVGRADRGLLVTTGTFTKEAKKEAQREGAPLIDLLDGYEFVEKLKELDLGTEVHTVEKVEIKKEWFENL
ncbi:restriction endonuclease [Patescibacteria group bacterium]|nr:restriction endonuclease [Patescibacteria group bacterium]